MLTLDGQLKVVDFGIAKSLGSLTSVLAERDLPVQPEGGHTQTGQVIGKRAYMAPERLRGDEGPGADLFSLGVVAWEFLAGRRPYRAELAPAAPGEGPEGYVPLRNLRPEVPEVLAEILAHAIDRSPESRLKNFEAFAHALREVSRVLPPIDPGVWVRAQFPEEWERTRNVREDDVLTQLLVR